MYLVREKTPHERFDRIVETLCSKGLTTFAAAEAFIPSIDTIGKDTSFLWIPPKPPEMTFTAMMALITYNNRRGANYLSKMAFADRGPIPEGAYLMVDIEDGRSRLNVSQAESKANIRREGRLAYTLYETMIHCIVFPEVLEAHNLSILGTFCLEGGSLHIRADREGPTLACANFDFPNARWGAPSCKERRDLHDAASLSRELALAVS